jgi:hypothetical protein
VIDEALVSRTRQRARSPKAHRLRMSWWLHPRLVILFLGIPFLVSAYLIPENTYIALYLSEKYVDLNFLVVGSIIYAGLIAGSFFAISTGVQSQENDVILYCRWFVWPLFVFTALGYIVWFAYPLILPGGFAAFASALFDLVFRSSPGASDTLKFYVFQTIPGITTFAQFGILYATVEALLWVWGNTQKSLALMRFTVIASATLLRATLLSERLAIIEIAVPVAIVFFGLSRWARTNRLLVSLTPLLGGLAVFALFAVTEHFRSWTYYQVVYPGSYLQFAAERLFGYYATAINNAALYYYYEPIQPLRHSLGSLFSFPGVGEKATASYEVIFGGNAIPHEQLLEVYANYEFNNVAMIGLLLNEFSIFLAPLAAFSVGLISLSLYRSFVIGRLVGLLLYPSWFVGLLEISRIYYWPNQRYFPTLAFLAISLLIFFSAKVPHKNMALKRRYRQRVSN